MRNQFAAAQPWPQLCPKTRAGWCARHLRAALVLFAALLAFSPSRELAAQTYSGQQVKPAVDASLDILKDQVNFLGTQDRYDAVLGYVSGTYKLSPMHFASSSGTRSGAMGSRVETMVGAGWGTTSGYGVFGGAWTDIIQMGPAKEQAIQGIAFIGASAWGFQVAYDYFLKDDFAVDAFGNFGGAGGNDSYSYVPGGVNKGSRGAKDAFVAYHSTGASLLIVRDRLASGDSGVAEVRVQFQPLVQWLDARFGLPIVALQKLAGYKANGDTTNGAQLFQQDADGGASPWEIEFGSDNLLASGIRAHAIIRVAPTVNFRRAELAKYHDFGNLTVAARAFAFERGGDMHAGFDSFLLYSISKPGAARKEPVGWPFAIAASYSFNSPDPSTFVPLPDAHVFGLQLVLGVPETAKPLVPIIRPKQDQEVTK